MPELSGEHGRLPAMMGMVRERITEEAGNARTKVPDAAIAL